MDVIVNSLHQGYSVIVPFIILLGLLIFVHELGHFLVAKYFGVRVEVFSIGFGKKLWSKKSGDTTYALGIFPLGGYVKMFGDEIGAEIPESEKKYSFVHKHVLQRMAVVLAGPFMNLIFAIVLYFIIVMVGENVQAPVTGDISSDSVAYQVGFRSGDRIQNVGTTKIKSWADFQDKLSEYIGSYVEVSVLRAEDQKTEILKITPISAPNPNIVGIKSIVGDISGLTHASLASVVGILDENSVWAKAGLKTGDVISQINGQEVKTYRDFSKTIRKFQNQEVEVSGERLPSENAKETEKFKFKIQVPAFTDPNSLSGLEPSDLYLAKIIPGSPAAKAGFQAGDKLAQINGQPVKQWEEIQNTIKKYKESMGPLNFTVLRKGQELQLKGQPQMTEATNIQGMHENRYTIGIVPWYVQTAPIVEKITQDNILDGFNRSVFKCYEATIMILNGFVKLFRAQISSKNIGGIISIGQAASETFKLGWIQFINMMALVSINLFVLNLLPVPVLDGGHMVFYTIELLKGSPLSLKKMELAQRVGIVVLMSLMIFSLFNDFSRLFS